MVFGFMSSETPQPGKETKKPVIKSAQRLEPAVAPEREADIYDVLGWLDVNKKKIGVVALAAIVIGFAVYTWTYLNDQKGLKASTALLDLKPSMSTPTNTPPIQASAFEKVASDYPGTAPAERAEILAATSLFTEGKYPEAHARFSKFLNDHPQSPWASEAQYGIAASLEAQNKPTEAAAAYQNVFTAYGSSSVAGDAKLALARLYEAQQKPEQALRLYNELLPSGPAASRMPGRSEAYTKREALYKQFPWLNTNKPMASLSPMVIPSGATNTNAAPKTALPTNQVLQLTTPKPAPSPTAPAPANPVPPQPKP
jgi:TolA-binding protein